MSASSRISGDARRILQEHAKKAYQQNAFPQPWRNLPEVPSAEEIKPRSVSASIERDGGPDPWNEYQTDLLYDSDLPNNHIHGPWSSKEAYIGAHYQILREDAIASLRNSVVKVSLKTSMVDDGETCIYTDVSPSPQPPPRGRYLAHHINPIAGYLHWPATKPYGRCISRRILYGARRKTNLLGAIEAPGTRNNGCIDAGSRHVPDGLQDCHHCSTPDSGWS